MNDIVCATRGGEGSRAVQLAAIERARETGRPLVFLYVADPGSLGDVGHALEAAVREELIWMGKALLRIAQRRAKQEGLTCALVIREGSVRDEIAQYLTTHKAGLLLLGAPRGIAANVFSGQPENSDEPAIERFAADIHHSTGVPVEIVSPAVSGIAIPGTRPLSRP
jgi:nucleotide-binding universal stress UspA family protein